MKTATRAVRIDSPKEQVWAALADFGGVWKYNPSVVTSRSTTPQNGGVGAARHCDLTFSGASVEERIVEWNEGNGYRIEVFDSKRTPPFKQAFGDIDLWEDGDGTVVTMTFSHSMKYGPIGALMDRLVVETQYAKALDLLLAGLKHHIETGQDIVKGVRVDTGPVRLVAAQATPQQSHSAV